MVKINFIIKCHGYDVLVLKEADIIDRYFLEYDIEPIAKLLKSDFNMTPGMRQFIADVLTGKIKKKKPSPYSRDVMIYLEYRDIQSKYPDKPLRGNKNTEGIADIVGEKFEMNDDAVIKAIERIKKKRDKDGYLCFIDEGCWESAQPTSLDDIL